MLLSDSVKVAWNSDYTLNQGSTFASKETQLHIVIEQFLKFLDKMSW